jgi:hypothetical protein
LQELFKTIGLMGKPAHKAPLETPYPVERREHNEYEDSAAQAGGVIVTRTHASATQAMMA